MGASLKRPVCVDPPDLPAAGRGAHHDVQERQGPDVDGGDAGDGAGAAATPRPGPPRLLPGPRLSAQVGTVLVASLCR